MRMSNLLVLGMVLVGLLFFGLNGFAAEHPGRTAEHPGKTAEHPGGMVSPEEVRKAITDYIREDSKLKGGDFLVLDSEKNTVLRLKLVRIHDKVAQTKDGYYFACGDFQDAANPQKTYDLDVWLKKRGDELVPARIVIHKEDGKTRFTYKEDEIVPVIGH